ncbi:MAG: hypothetical protein IAA81_02245 [Spirochaetes bacterium]|uniref:Uncharacterized protein n=1 Tax=Candidatus Gallitreponema excrementavium TaxID=2840840 RepID=A0A9D9HNE4_9SPIR|nr:hypothetical protein [Candidatus Gallitreponema excrementavium]
MLSPYSYDNLGRCYRRILTTISADAIAVFLRQSRQMLSPYSYDNPGRCYRRILTTIKVKK